MYIFLLTPLREGRRSNGRGFGCKYIFLLTPLREGRREDSLKDWKAGKFLLTPLREGRRPVAVCEGAALENFYSRPCGRGDRRRRQGQGRTGLYFYSRPCGRGDIVVEMSEREQLQFLLTPLREGRRYGAGKRRKGGHFYSRPCGRGDAGQSWRNLYATRISTHAPAGGATKSRMLSLPSASNFYSRPCGRGDQLFWRLQIVLHRFLLTPLREGRQDEIAGLRCGFIISTHAPAGGATHKCLKS